MLGFRTATAILVQDLYKFLLADHPDRMICRLLVADNCRVGEPTHFDIPHRRLTEEALVLAVELTRALIADFERRARGIEPFSEHSFSRRN